MSEKFFERRPFQSPDSGDHGSGQGNENSQDEDSNKESNGTGHTEPNNGTGQENPLSNPDTENESLKIPDTLTLDYFWRSVVKQKFEPMSEDEADQMIDNRYFADPPLVPLTPEEEIEIKKNLRERLLSYNIEKLKEIAEIEIALVNEKDNAYQSRPKSVGRDKYLLINNDFFDQHEDVKQWMEENNIPFLTIEQKIQALSNPDIFFDGRYYSGLYGKSLIGGSGLSGFGQRSLDDYNLPLKFERILSGVRSSVKRERITVMDIGGGIGKALDDMRNIDSNMETINLTITEEPAMYPTDKLILCPAERMPADLEKKVDLAFSSVASRISLTPTLLWTTC